MTLDLEVHAYHPTPLDAAGFNPNARLPYGCTNKHIRQAMNDFLEFLSFINEQLHDKRIAPLESMLMPANFSSIVGEFLASSIPRYCSMLVRNRYHNGHPDLIPAHRFRDNAAQHSREGIEIKASHYFRGWQGHNPENCFLLVFVFDSSRPSDSAKKVNPKPFRFEQVLGARLTQRDWVFSGRSATSRRTITASVTESGYRKMIANWIYRIPPSTTRK